MMENLPLDLLFHLIPFLNNKAFYAFGTTNKAIVQIWPWRQRLIIPPPWMDVWRYGYINIEPGQENFEMRSEHFSIFYSSAGRKRVLYYKGHEEEVKMAWFDRFGEECPPLHYECDVNGSLTVPFDFHPLNILNYGMGKKGIIIYYCRNGEPLSEVIKWLWPMIVEARIHNI